MKTLIGGPEDFERKKPQNKFERQKPGDEYKKLPKSETFPHNLPKTTNTPISKEERWNPKPTRSTQFHKSVDKSKNPYENGPKLNWEHK
jgi:hypothetical protein